MADNALGVGKSEDWEYCQRIRDDGYLVGCLKDQVIVHCGLTNSEGNQIPGYEESLKLAKSIMPEAILL
jgi:GT2 family glycosyltransferase